MLVGKLFRVVERGNVVIAYSQSATGTNKKYFRTVSDVNLHFSQSLKSCRLLFIIASDRPFVAISTRASGLT